ncbi:MAG: AmmeMemoRadiSam system protein B [Candidatus Marsarchaeota archaeon]|nr:AmmeMemoRadiSam system protein B [Candidatus Marsarchaeota archaeon]
MTRDYAFAGSFYPKAPNEISGLVNAYIEKARIANAATAEFISCVAPHAGYVYSGSVAGYTYRALSLNKRLGAADTVVLVGPNHTGYGTPVSVSMEDWKTPLGVVRNDLDFSRAMVDSSDMLSEDEAAHAYEHSIEVQLPFLQTVASGKRFAFVCMGDQSPDYSAALTEAITNAEKALRRHVIVIASSDFDHYEPAAVARGKDMKLIEALKVMDHAMFNRLVEELDDSACGFGPITVALLYAKAHGGKRGDLLRYSNSGEATGDSSSVVAYASMTFV